MVDWSAKSLTTSNLQYCSIGIGGNFGSNGLNLDNRNKPFVISSRLDSNLLDMVGGNICSDRITKSFVTSSLFIISSVTSKFQVASVNWNQFDGTFFRDMWNLW